MALLALLAGLSVPLYLNFQTDRALQNASHLIQGDLRLAQQSAVSKAGSGPRVEMCFRNDGSGYEVYVINYEDAVNRTGDQVGPTLKAANAGQEYRSGITVAITPSPAASCTSPFSGEAIAFSGAGTPVNGSGDAPQQTITLTLSGRTYRVVIAPGTGRVTAER